MKALVLSEKGSFKNLQIQDMAEPEPAVGEVKVKIHAVGLNPVDYKLAAVGHPAWVYPMILGLDVAGEVVQVSTGEASWNVGDQVFYHGDISKPGGFAEYSIAASHSISRIPDGLTYIEAAAIPCAGFTAYQALVRKLNVKAGHSILISGGAGGVGSFAIQIACSLGVEVIATCSSSNIEFLYDLGARHVIDYTNENISERVLDITEGRGVDYVLDAVSADGATNTLECLIYGGGLACVAGLPDLSVLQPWMQAPSIHVISLGGAYASGDRAAQIDLSAMGDELGAMAANGVVLPIIDEVVDFDGIKAGLERLTGRHVRGKIVAAISEETEKLRMSDPRWAEGKPGPEEVRVPTMHPDQYWNGMYWNELTEKEQSLWATLGWSAESWRGEQNPPPTYNTGWDHLEDNERESAEQLGYDESTWNTPDKDDD